MKVFFNKRNTDQPLTESELRDSNNKLQDSSFFRRSHSYNRAPSNYQQIIRDDLCEGDYTNPEIQICKNYNQENLITKSFSYGEGSKSSYSPHREMTELEIEQPDSNVVEKLSHLEKLDPNKNGTAEFKNLKR